VLVGRAQSRDPAAAQVAEFLSRMTQVRLADRSPVELAQQLDDILGEDREAFLNVESALCSAFPNVQGIVLRRVDPTSPQKTLFFRVSGDAVIRAEEISGGVVAFTALLTEVYKVGVDARDILLIEEPENGVHPGRLPQLVTHLKELSKRCQILLATHSPYFLDLFPPEAVRVFGRTASGDVIVRNMAELPIVAEWLEAGNSLGEMWFNLGEDHLLGLEPPAPAP
jgi:predicted ATPase